jgi:hypothetical protein
MLGRWCTIISWKDNNELSVSLHSITRDWLTWEVGIPYLCDIELGLYIVKLPPSILNYMVPKSTISLVAILIFLGIIYSGVLE